MATTHQERVRLIEETPTGVITSHMSRRDQLGRPFDGLRVQPMLTQHWEPPMDGLVARIRSRFSFIVGGESEEALELPDGRKAKRKKGTPTGHDTVYITPAEESEDATAVMKKIERAFPESVDTVRRAGAGFLMDDPRVSARASLDLEKVRYPYQIDEESASLYRGGAKALEYFLEHEVDIHGLYRRTCDMLGVIPQVPGIRFGCSSEPEQATAEFVGPAPDGAVRWIPERSRHQIVSWMRSRTPTFIHIPAIKLRSPETACRYILHEMVHTMLPRFPALTSIEEACTELCTSRHAEIYGCDWEDMYVGEQCQMLYGKERGGFSLPLGATDRKSSFSLAATLTCAHALWDLLGRKLKNLHTVAKVSRASGSHATQCIDPDQWLNEVTQGVDVKDLKKTFLSHWAFQLPTEGQRCIFFPHMHGTGGLLTAYNVRKVNPEFGYAHRSFSPNTAPPPTEEFFNLDPPAEIEDEQMRITCIHENGATFSLVARGQFSLDPRYIVQLARQSTAHTFCKAGTFRVKVHMRDEDDALPHGKGGVDINQEFIITPDILRTTHEWEPPWQDALTTSPSMRVTF